MKQTSDSPKLRYRRLTELAQWFCISPWALFIWLLTTQPAASTEFRIDSTVAANPARYGVVFDIVDATLTINPTEFVINPTGPSPRLIIRYLTIKPGQRWQTLYLDTSNITVWLSSTSGEMLLPPTFIPAFSSFDISDKMAAKNGEVLTLTLQVSLPTTIYSIVLTYQGNSSLLCYPSPWTPGKGNLQLSYELEDIARVSLRIYDNTGRMVAIIRNEELLSGGWPYQQQNDIWQGRTLSGALAASGIYHAVLEVKYLRQNLTSYESRFRFVIAR